ncbi:MAG: hypothetical protein QXP81_09465 [Nitrososphaerota archaeon]
MRRSVPLAIALLVLTITGVLGVWGAREVVERTTVTTVLPGTTYVTVTVYGGEGNLVIESPRVFVTMVIERESQVCTVIFRKTQQTASVIAFPGTTVIVPGATATLTLSAPLETTVTRTLATRTTHPGVHTATTIMTVGDFAMTVPVWYFGEMEEMCRIALELVKQKWVPERLPATVVIRFAGATFAFPGFTITLPPMPLDSGPAFTTTYITTKAGTTETHQYTIERTTVTLQVATWTTETVTITRPGSTVTTVILVTRTIEEETTPTARTAPKTAATTPVTTTTPMAATTPTVQQTPSSDLMVPIAIAIAAAVGIGVALGIAVRRRRSYYY